jgi:hypothetical protein
MGGFIDLSLLVLRIDNSSPRRISYARRSWRRAEADATCVFVKGFD